MKTKGYRFDLGVICAERDEIRPFLKNFSQEAPGIFTGRVENKNVVVLMSGVGKKSVKRRITAFLLDHDITAKAWINVGNAGALKPLPSGTLIPLGQIIGKNGKKSVEIDSALPLTGATVNKLLPKKQLQQQYPEAHCVDMEAFHLTRIIPDISILKIILDTEREQPVDRNGRIKRKYRRQISRNAKLLTEYLSNLLRTGW